jgi:predicted MFS family arabinose efflux permease
MKIAFTSGFKNVWILSLSCALAGSIIPLMVLVGSLVGADLAPSVALATAPIALMISGTALAVVPVSRSMQALGRKKALWLFMGLGILGCALAILSLQLQSFIMFCLTSVLLGTTNTALLQTRFIAMESVAIEHSATAASVVMAGGIIAGRSLHRHSRNCLKFI